MIYIHWKQNMYKEFHYPHHLVASLILQLFKHAWTSSRLKSRAKISDLDVGESDSSVRISSGDHCRIARSGRAWASSTSRSSTRGAVEPLHATTSIHPDAEDEHHAMAERTSHTSHASLSLISADTTEGLGLGIAVSVVDAVGSCHACNVNVGVGNDFSILDIVAADGLEGPVGSAVGCDELSNNSELASRVDSLVGSIKSWCTHAVGVEITATLIAHATAGAIGSLAGISTGDVTRVRSECRSSRIGFPDIHLVAASTEGAIDIGL